MEKLIGWNRTRLAKEAWCMVQRCYTDLYSNRRPEFIMVMILMMVNVCDFGHIDFRAGLGTSLGSNLLKENVPPPGCKSISKAIEL